MKKYFIVTAIIILGISTLKAQNTDQNMPRLVKKGQSVQLWVDNKPFLILGGELGNSSASSADYMKPIWPKLKKMDVNTVFTPVYWELMEPAEGKFNFRLLDDAILSARKNNIKLALLWFGSWKNSMSCYAPAWVKTNILRFPRAEDKNNVKQEILTPFSKNNLLADKQAFVKLSEHLKTFDGKMHTVIAIQVENEIGMLPNARTYDAGANRAFRQTVPQLLLNYLKNNKDNLLPETKAIWAGNGYQTSGNWEEIFGKSLATEELFMAWYYARYVNEIAQAGKKAYNLPMYLNAALNAPGKKPGEYPSAGPLPQVMDAWKAGAPAIDIFAPDFYNPDFKHWSDLYTRSASSLFIPEIRFEPGVDAKAFFAFGNYNCISFSPFSIESTQKPEAEPIGKTYHILKQVTPLLTRYNHADAIRGFLCNKDSSAQKTTLGNYVLTITHEYKLGWEVGAKNPVWPQTGVLIINTAPNEYYVAGTGVVITFEPVLKGRAGFLSIDEGSFINDQWVPRRRMNGDQDHQGRHVRIPVDEYSIRHVKLYSY
ncbi:DUF5597 domain-containing protein [Mucilaginibacter sp. cycad4]|uniref:GH35 family beta-galactosidase n=1 Tax=Mucilaginibacter sp. cycad4 TaxID=3342096 RepID=UPI002AAC4D6A|nr:DUF5597 domain-containing protein [Mucilaginibacter gossypii]WPV02131.1 DUF5597 domain-containing protein [Mucilaginibacter gossypii]